MSIGFLYSGKKKRGFELLSEDDSPARKINKKEYHHVYKAERSIEIFFDENFSGNKNEVTCDIFYAQEENKLRFKGTNLFYHPIKSYDYKIIRRKNSSRLLFFLKSAGKFSFLIPSNCDLDCRLSKATINFFSPSTRKVFSLRASSFKECEKECICSCHQTRFCAECSKKNIESIKFNHNKDFYNAQIPLVCLIAKKGTIAIR